MKKIIFTILVIIIVGVLVFIFRDMNTNRILDSEDLISKYKNTQNAILIDVRTPIEFDGGHIEGAVNLDYQNPNFINEVKKLDKDKTYFVYCRSGNRSSKSISIMKNYGIKDIYDLKGGIINSTELLK